MIYNEESVLWQTCKRRLFVFSFLILVLCLTVLPIWEKIGMQPMLLLIIVYHWSVYRPDLLPFEQLVLLSLILDGVYAYPLGFSALRLLGLYTLLMTQKRILSYQRFHWVWAGFAVFVMVDAMIYGILLSCVKQEWTGILPLLPGSLLTIALYPPIVWVLNRFMVKHLTG
jgi:rod shape-determining protein MreD